ncbi:hypothetical protein Tco_0948271 [Tanacetum coccineum]
MGTRSVVTGNVPVRYEGDLPDNGPKYLTGSGTYHGLINAAALAVVCLMIPFHFMHLWVAHGKDFGMCTANDEQILHNLLCRRKNS